MILYALISIFSLFFLLLPFRKYFCVLCASSFLTWVWLLIAYHLGFHNDVVLTALLMGMSLLGLFYLWEKKYAKYGLFKLPMLLTLLLIGYSLFLENVLFELLFIVVIWLIFITIFIYRNNPVFKSKIDKIVECCKKW